jgi:hypothetical protein
LGKEAEMIGTLVRKINESARCFFYPPRKDFRFPLKVSIEPDKTDVNLRRKITGKLVNLENIDILIGESKDFSEVGIAFTVSQIRTKDGHLVGDGRTLNIELILPNGNISFQAIGQRYEANDQHSSAPKYLIGAKITKISSNDKEIYLSYLHNNYVESVIESDTAKVDFVLNLPR